MFISLLVLAGLAVPRTIKTSLCTHFASPSLNFNIVLVTAILRTTNATSHFFMSAKIPKLLFINSTKALFSKAVFSS